MWKYYNPTFEFRSEMPLNLAYAPWGGHSYFAYDLVANTKPKLIVELGTYKGNSLFAMAQAVKDLKLNTSLRAVDTWQGDAHSGFYGDEIWKTFNKALEHYKDLDIHPHRMLFDQARDKFEDGSIDILHIDGLHTYEAVKHDLDNWSPKVKSNGIVMFHDIAETGRDFGVYRLWEELEGVNTLAFPFYHGLGVVFLGNKLGDKPVDNACIDHYKQLADKLG